MPDKYFVFPAVMSNLLLLFNFVFCSFSSAFSGVSLLSSGKDSAAAVALVSSKKGILFSKADFKSAIVLPVILDNSFRAF